jgi:cytochrome b561
VKKKWSAWLRAWHWLNAISVLFLGVSGILIMQGDELEDFAIRPHVLMGFVFTSLVVLRFIRMGFGDTRTLSDAKHYATQALAMLKKQGLPRNRADFHVFHKAGIKGGYIGVFALLAGFVATGLSMVVMSQMGSPEEYRHIAKEAHEILFYLMLIFIPLHVGGVVLAELTDEPNITSDMIHGGKE